MNNISSIINNMTIFERKDGRFEARISVKGNRKSFYGKTKVEIKQKVKEYLMKVENGYKEPKKISFDEYMMYWLKTYKLNKIEPTSYSRLYSVYIHQVKDVLGKKKIGDITTADIQALIDGYANPVNPKDKALALSGLKKIVHLLSPCFRTAIREGIIHKNPCDDIIFPKESCVQVPRKE